MKSTSVKSNSAEWTVTGSATNSRFGFTSESPDRTETRHVIVKVSLPHESGDKFCALPDAEEQLIETDSADFFCLVRPVRTIARRSCRFTGQAPGALQRPSLKFHLRLPR